MLGVDNWECRGRHGHDLHGKDWKPCDLDGAPSVLPVNVDKRMYVSYEQVQCEWDNTKQRGIRSLIIIQHILHTLTQQVMSIGIVRLLGVLLVAFLLSC